MFNGNRCQGARLRESASTHMLNVSLLYFLVLKLENKFFHNLFTYFCVHWTFKRHDITQSAQVCMKKAEESSACHNIYSFISDCVQIPIGLRLVPVEVFSFKFKVRVCKLSEYLNLGYNFELNSWRNSILFSIPLCIYNHLQRWKWMNELNYSDFHSYPIEFQRVKPFIFSSFQTQKISMFSSRLFHVILPEV